MNYPSAPGLPGRHFMVDRLTGRGTTRAEVAHGTPTQSHISPSKPVYEDDGGRRWCAQLLYTDRTRLHARGAVVLRLARIEGA